MHLLQYKMLKQLYRIYQPLLPIAYYCASFVANNHINCHLKIKQIDSDNSHFDIIIFNLKCTIYQKSVFSRAFYMNHWMGLQRFRPAFPAKPPKVSRNVVHPKTTWKQINVNLKGKFGKIYNVFRSFLLNSHSTTDNNSFPKKTFFEIFTLKTNVFVIPFSLFTNNHTLGIQPLPFVTKSTILDYFHSLE